MRDLYFKWVTTGWWLCWSLTAAQAEIWADFEVSRGEDPLGTFRARLFYQQSPRTVGSFIGLAQGSLPWIDLTTGNLKRAPYFNQLTFHRLIHSFVIQGGSPNGQGTDGPGYRFEDELDPELRHSSRYILSMANSGPNTNGSQFFITLRATPELDGNHTVFGEVISGRDIVDGFADPDLHPTPQSQSGSGGDKPITDIVLNRVTIIREGTPEDLDFDETDQNLPVPNTVAAQLQVAGNTFFLHFDRVPHQQARVYASPNLSAWNFEAAEYFADDLRPFSLDVTSLAVPDGEVLPRLFFKLPVVAYQAPVFTPGSLARTTLDMTITRINGQAASESMGFVFDESGQRGTYTFSLFTPGDITSGEWNPEGPGGVLFVLFEGDLAPMRLTFGFDAALSGRFSGTVFAGAGNVSLDGTFVSEINQ